MRDYTPCPRCKRAIARLVTTGLCIPCTERDRKATVVLTWIFFGSAMLLVGVLLSLPYILRR